VGDLTSIANRGRKIMNIYTWLASELYQSEDKPPVNGKPLWANQHFKTTHSLSRQQVAGPGVYAIFYLEKLIYIGTFNGIGTDSCGGNITTIRWNNHLGGFTSRDHRISFNQKVIQQIAMAKSGSDPGNGFANADPKVLSKDQACVSTYNRFLFSTEYWHNFSGVLDKNIMKDFKFTYFQISPQTVATVSDVRKLVLDVETGLIKELRPRCNSKTLPHLAYTEHSVDFVIEKINEALKDAIKAKRNNRIDFSGINQPLSKLNLHVKPATIKTKPESETAIAQTNFLNRIEGNQAAQAFIKAIMDLQSPNLEIHFTKTNGADLRIRYKNLNKPRNIFTIYWQVNNQGFSGRTYLPVNQCQLLGLKGAVKDPDPLPTKFFVLPAQHGMDETIIKVIKESIKHLDNRN
jgi:hypothetical protein